MAPPPPDQNPVEDGSPRPGCAVPNLLEVVGRALTHYPDVVTVAPATPAREAIRLLHRRQFSQVPVVDRGQVTGLFSYRSFALAVADVFDLPGRHRADGLSVWECIETPTYLQGADDVHRLFVDLDRRDAVLVGAPARCDGIVTAMGVLRYLYEAASPYLLVAEIELALRAVITLSVDPAEMPAFAGPSLSHYRPESLPTRPADMTFNDYVLLIGHGDNWDRFNRVFQADRSLTHAKLKQVRDLRNDVFHHRRPLTPQDHDLLAAARDWTARLAAAARDVWKLS